jgi:hypothetical protein
MTAPRALSAALLPAVLLGAAAGCSDFPLPVGPEPPLDFESVVFAPELGIDREDFTPSSQVWVRVDEVGSEEAPAAATGDVVRVWYEGWTSAGLRFDAHTPDDGEARAFLVGSPAVLAGLSRGVTGIRAGGIRTVIVPPALGFGSRGADPVPPGAWLVFRIEAEGVVPADSVSP